jgi:hypothetical protein
MMIKPPSRTSLALGSAVLGLALVLTGCADDTATSGRTDETTAPETATTTTDEPDAVPLPITDHVLGADGLPGFTGNGKPETQDLQAFAEEHDKSVGELRRSGFRSGASLFFEGDGQEGFALSVAAEYADRASADAEADRLFASNTEGDPAIRTRPLDVPGVADVRAASLHGSDHGMRLTGVEIVFVDGGVMHELFAVGEAASFDTDAVVSAAAALHDEVAGHPVG